jgi:calcium-dependent protein kinase
MGNSSSNGSSAHSLKSERSLKSESSSPLKGDGNTATARKDFRERLSLRRKASEFEEDYKVVSELGQGITGKVYQVINKRGQEKAMKTINLSRINRSQIKELRLEVSLLKTLDHPNIVRLTEVFEDARSVMLVMDLCKGGNLSSASGRARLRTEREVASVIYQLFLAIKYVHEHKIIHRDIKMENVMFVSEDPKSLHVQLIDFGLSGVQKQTPFWLLRKKKRLFATTCGTTFYMAPEVIDAKYDERCDIWSLGVLTFLLLTGKPPFYSEEGERTTIKLIKKANVDFSSPIWEKLSPHARILVQNLLVADPAKRWTAEKALESPWFDAYREEIQRNVSSSSALSGATLEGDIVSSLAKFVNYGKMKKTAMLVMAHHSSVKELSALRNAFLALDKDNSGTITFNELKTLLMKHKMTEDEATRLFLSVDVDESGEIQLTEFLAATMEATCKVDRERMADAFDHIANGESYITTNHLESLLGKIDKKQLQEMIRSLDENGDGKISRDEFLALVDEKQEEEVEHIIENDEHFLAVRESVDGNLE